MLFRRTVLVRSATNKSRSFYASGLPTADGLGRVEKSGRFDDKWEMYFTGNYSKGELAKHLEKQGSSFIDAQKDFYISPWHGLAAKPPADPDEATKVNNLYTFVNEIPLGTREKVEMKPQLAFNPLRQDRFKKDNSLRTFLYGKMPFNYGFIPRTIEDPTVHDPHLKMDGIVGDGDPIDVVELSTSKPIETGEVVVVRVLGVLALIDEGECDWKVITSAAGRNDPHSYKRISDVPQTRIDQIVDWFKMYKTADGKPQNQFGFASKILDEAFAMEVIETTRAQYDDLRAGKSKAKGYWLPEMEE